MAVIVVGVTDRNDTLISYRDENDLGDWMVFVESTDEMIREYAVRQQATKLAVGRDGVIIERKPFGSNPEAYWRGILDRLLASPEAAAQAPAEPEPTAAPIVAAQPATPTAAPSTAEPEPTTAPIVAAQPATPTAAQAPAEPEPTTAPIMAAQPTTPPTAEPTDTPAPVVAQGWRTDLAVGGNIGEVAPDTTLTLVSGETTSVQQVAGGRPVLVYFFESW